VRPNVFRAGLILICDLFAEGEKEHKLTFPRLLFESSTPSIKEGELFLSLFRLGFFRLLEHLDDDYF